jgi:hypothetical protein
MSTFFDPTLTVEPVADHDAQRRLRVVYELDLKPGDRLIGQTIGEHVVVHAVDEHDAAAFPAREPVAEQHATFVGATGLQRREVEFTVHRSALDVQQDWWSSGPAGEVRPIAEWPDHIAADIHLSLSGHVVAETTTRTVTGSWGALGEPGE